MVSFPGTRRTLAGAREAKADLNLREGEPEDDERLALVVEGEPVAHGTQPFISWCTRLGLQETDQANNHSTVDSMHMMKPMTTQYMSHTSSFCRSLDLMALYEA